MKIKKRNILVFIVIIGLILFFVSNLFKKSYKEVNAAKAKQEIKLPPVQKIGKVSVEEAISKRRSVREYKDKPLALKEISQILWAAQGITVSWGGRAAPSAGALYPLEVYVVVGKLEGLEPAVYHYKPGEHSLVKIADGDKRLSLFSAGLFQSSIKNAPVSFVICAEYSRTTKKYGERGKKYVHIEVGHVGQNIYLQAQSLALATVAIGAFSDWGVKKVLNLDTQEPLYIMPVGMP